MSVLELADLVKALEQKFGVTAAMPVAISANAGAAANSNTLIFSIFSNIS